MNVCDSAVVQWLIVAGSVNNYWCLYLLKECYRENGSARAHHDYMRVYMYAKVHVAIVASWSASNKNIHLVPGIAHRELTLAWRTVERITYALIFQKDSRWHQDLPTISCILCTLLMIGSKLP